MDKRVKGRGGERKNANDNGKDKTKDKTKDGALKGRRYVFQGGNQVCGEEQRPLQSSVREPESE